MKSSARVEDVFAGLLAQIDLLLPRAADGEPVPEREHADVVADLLAYLAERMTALHERRQAEQRAFLAWLEESLGCRVDELSGKTSVRDYYAQPEGAGKLLEVIERNHPAKTNLDISAPRDYGGSNPERDRIIAGYERSMDILRPLLRQIELTDALIDRIVYRLYNLTGAEIAIVEASR